MKRTETIPDHPGISTTQPAQITAEGKYSAIVENSVHAFFLTKPDGTILESNSAASRLFGYTQEEFKLVKRQQLMDHNDPKVLEAIRKRDEEGHIMLEIMAIKKNGEQFPAEITSTLFKDNDGVVKTSTMLTDISEREQTKMVLQENENRLRTIVNSAPECIKLLNEAGELLEMNPAGLDMIEAGRFEQVAGKKIAEIVLPEYRDAFTRLHSDAFKGSSGKLQFIIRGLKGTLRHLETQAVPLKNSSGEIISVLGITRDITENKNAEALLLASEERYRYLFNNNPASIIIWDIDTLDIIEVNETAVELYGYSRKRFLQLSVLDLRPESEHKKFLALVHQAQQNEFSKKTVTWRHRTAKGATIIVEVTSHTILYNGKRAVLALGKDVTENILLENSLNEERQIRQKQITDAVITGQEKERSQLGEELHDNINQILATTRLYLESYLAGPQPRIDLIKESKLLLEKAMLEIRLLSKTLLPPSLGEIGLLDALGDLIENFKGLKSMQISTDWKGFPEESLTEKLRLTIFRIVQEQLNNISKHAKAKHVEISLKKIHDTIQLNIKDDGIGFNTDTKRTGVGLRNMISRAEVNNGTVIIDSAPGGGCKLEVNFLLSEN